MATLLWVASPPIPSRTLDGGWSIAAERLMVRTSFILLRLTYMLRGDI
jgi:hypothetical protein